MVQLQKVRDDLFSLRLINEKKWSLQKLTSFNPYKGKYIALQFLDNFLLCDRFVY